MYFLGGLHPLSLAIFALTLVITIYAQVRVSSTFKKYAKVESSCDMTAHMVAREMLDYNGLDNVEVRHVSGNLSDHYDPSKQVLCLSDSVYSSKSVAALGVAAHEVGHAIQHAEGYGPLKVRSALVPITKFSSMASWILILLGAFMSNFGLIQFGIVLFAIILVFQLVTLPVEFNASNRALAALEGGGYMPASDIPKTKKVLDAAGFTYVAAVLVSVLEIIRLIIIFGGNRE